LLIEQDAMRVTQFTRPAASQPQTLVAGDTAHLASVAFTLPVADLYVEVELGD
jgi:hypothetical protein